jgi:hypothetical protein
VVLHGSDFCGRIYLKVAEGSKVISPQVMDPSGSIFSRALVRLEVTAGAAL